MAAVANLLLQHRSHIIIEEESNECCSLDVTVVAANPLMQGALEHLNTVFPGAKSTFQQEEWED